MAMSPHPDRPADPPADGRSETEAERIDRNVAELLQELRFANTVAIAGFGDGGDRHLRLGQRDTDD